MLKIAIPNKGALSEDTIQLIREAGYKVRREGRELSLADTANDVEFLFLRPRDIAIYVGSGIVDLGVTGRDLLCDSEAAAIELMALGFGKSRFCYAVPEQSNLLPENFGGLRIATSYPNIVRQDARRRGLDVAIVKLDGAVEISVQLGIADAIADVVESGATMRQAGLKPVGEPVMQSEAIVIGHDAQAASQPPIRRFLKRLDGIIVARTYVMVEYDIPEQFLPAAVTITPGLESPTIAPLNKPGWFAVKSMVKRSELPSTIDRLDEAGAKGIIAMDVKTCRI